MGFLEKLPENCGFTAGKGRGFKQLVLNCAGFLCSTWQETSSSFQEEGLLSLLMNPRISVLSVLPITSSAPVSPSRWPDQLEKLCEQILFSRDMPGWHRAFAFCLCQSEIPGKSPISEVHCLSGLTVRGKGASFFRVSSFLPRRRQQEGLGGPGLQGRPAWEGGVECTRIF